LCFLKNIFIFPVGFFQIRNLPAIRIGKSQKDKRNNMRFIYSLLYIILDFVCPEAMPFKNNLGKTFRQCKFCPRVNIAKAFLKYLYRRACRFISCFNVVDTRPAGVDGKKCNMFSLRNFNKYGRNQFS